MALTRPRCLCSRSAATGSNTVNLALGLDWWTCDRRLVPSFLFAYDKRGSSRLGENRRRGMKKEWRQYSIQKPGKARGSVCRVRGGDRRKKKKKKKKKKSKDSRGSVSLWKCSTAVHPWVRVWSQARQWSSNHELLSRHGDCTRCSDVAQGPDLPISMDGVRCCRGGLLQPVKEREETPEKGQESKMKD